MAEYEDIMLEQAEDTRARELELVEDSGSLTGTVSFEVVDEADVEAFSASKPFNFGEGVAWYGR
jgi:hypothetical protein